MVRESLVGRRSLVTDLFILCTLCTRKYSLSSPYNSQAKTLNRQSVLAMRMAGRGLASLEKFFRIMDLPPPVTDPTFRAHKADTAAVATELLESKKVAAKELRRMQGTDDDDIIDATVPFDGTWAKSGFTSQFEIVFILSWDTGQSASYMKESNNLVPIFKIGGEVMKETAVWSLLALLLQWRGTVRCTHYGKLERKSKFAIHSLHFRWTLQDLQCT